ncbi:MAG: hypothetical protein R3A13_06890 [Bdellovibrionota bacterium]
MPRSFNDKSCACGCCPEEQKKCEENEGDVQPYNPSSADGSESCGCACGGDVGSGGAGEQSRKAMREECEQKAGDWIFTSKPAPECGECTCDPDAKQKCEADGGVWSEATCTCSECSPDSVEEDQCIADGCAWLELNCECRCGPTGAIWDPVLNLFVDKLTGRPLADINLNPVVDVVGPVGTLWDPERKIFVDPRSGLPLYDSFGEPLPGTPAFNAPQGTTWDPTRELYVDSETGVPRFDAERNPVAPGAIVTDQTRSDQAIIDPESPDIMLMP